MKFNLTESIDILSRTPSLLEVLLSGLPETWIRSNEGHESWSPFDIVGHLIHGELTDWVPRAMIILGDQEDKRFDPFDRNAQFQANKGKSMDELLTEFKGLREQNISKIRAMSINSSNLKWKGIHPDFGEVTLQQLLATWVVHDLAHVNQISRVMGRNYKEETGPWKKYFKMFKK